MEVRESKRIAVNVLATYGRSLYALAVGLFCGRWTLMSLGEVDYGLMGLVGGLMAFVTFLNNLMAQAVGRFYAFSVGQARTAAVVEEGVDECRRWFSVALLIHTAVPVVLVAIGYPAGVWAIERFLTIPPDRVGACLWVWRFTCLSGFVAMVNVPFQAMYTAKQEIAELTIYSFVTTTLNACFLGYMVTHPGVWLTRFAVWTCALGIAPSLIIAVRAVVKYPECRLRTAWLWDGGRFRELLTYAFARFLAELAGMVSGQARAILVNKYMGPRFNASMAIGNTVASQALTLSGSLSGALWPAVANKAGEGKESEVMRLSHMASRVSSLLVLVFALPLAVEIREVLRLWLVEPPVFAAEICVAVLLCDAFQRSTEGYWMVILGLGRGVVDYSRRTCLAGFVFVVVAWAAFAGGMGMTSVILGLVALAVTLVAVRLVMGRRLVGLSVRHWLRHVFVPLVALSGLTLAAGFVPRLLMEPSFLRVIVSTAVCEAVLLPLAWFLVLDEGEKEAVRRKIAGVWRRGR